MSIHSRSDPLEAVREPARTVMRVWARSGDAATPDLLTTLLWRHLLPEGWSASLATAVACLGGRALTDGRGATVRP